MQRGNHRQTRAERLLIADFLGFLAYRRLLLSCYLLKRKKRLEKEKPFVFPCVFLIVPPETGSWVVARSICHLQFVFWQPKLCYQNILATEGEEERSLPFDMWGRQVRQAVAHKEESLEGYCWLLSLCGRGWLPKLGFYITPVLGDSVTLVPRCHSLAPIKEFHPPAQGSSKAVFLINLVLVSDALLTIPSDWHLCTEKGSSKCKLCPCCPY